MELQPGAYLLIQSNDNRLDVIKVELVRRSDGHLEIRPREVNHVYMEFFGTPIANNEEKLAFAIVFKNRARAVSFEGSLRNGVAEGHFSLPRKINGTWRLQPVGSGNTTDTEQAGARKKYLGTWKWTNPESSSDTALLELHTSGRVRVARDSEAYNAAGRWTLKKEEGIEITLDEEEEPATGKIAEDGSLIINTPDNKRFVFQKRSEAEGQEELERN